MSQIAYLLSFEERGCLIDDNGGIQLWKKERRCVDNNRKGRFIKKKRYYSH